MNRLIDTDKLIKRIEIYEVIFESLIFVVCAVTFAAVFFLAFFT